MRPIVTHVVRSVGVYACLLAATVSCAKTGEPIEIPFAMWTCGPEDRLNLRCIPKPAREQSYLGKPKLARGRYTQLYSLGTAAMLPLATSLMLELAFIV